MEIFGDDTAKIDQLNEILCKKAGFPSCYDISYQTYPRKVDLNVANAVCGLGGTLCPPFFFLLPMHAAPFPGLTRVAQPPSSRSPETSGIWPT